MLTKEIIVKLVWNQSSLNGFNLDIQFALNSQQISCNTEGL